MKALIDIARMKKYLRQELSAKRYKHSVNVSKTAVELASRYGCDLHKAEIAGLVHDCTREMDIDTQLKLLKKLDVVPDEVTIFVKELVHAASAAYVCSQLFMIEDQEIISAVRYHTTAKADMTLLEKIIFLADFIEPAREFEGVDAIRDIAFRELDQAILMALNSAISFVLKKEKPIHIATIEARNHIILELNKRYDEELQLKK